MKSALVIGASRGIGRQICLSFARNGYNVGVAAKTVENTDKLPGTIYTVADEVSNIGVKSLPIICNVRKEEDINNAVTTCINQFGSLDCLVYNAGAILWKEVLQTPLKRYELMNEVNAKGAYCAVQAVGPHMLQRKSGKIVLISPRIYSRFFNGKTPYSMSKVAMTVLTHGFANEIEDTGVSITSLWPATVIEAHVTTVKNVPSRVMRKADIMADACLAIAKSDPESVNGQALIDEDFLRTHEGVEDFTKYRCDPENEPPRMMPRMFPDLRVAEQDATTPGMPSKL